MRTKIQSLLLVLFFIGTSIPMWAQSSTEGKEFWVGLTMAIRPPDNGAGEATPYLVISTKEKTKVTIASPAFPSEAIYREIDAFKWEKIEIPKKWWYPDGVGTPANVKEHADEVNKYGIFVQADKDISVFAVVRAIAGMDASNILPTTALGTEYILQDYIPHAKSGDAPYISMATILATEDNTEVTVKPSGTLLSATTPKLVGNKITLNQGETYYLMAENNGTDNNCLSGTEITSTKDIAVFQGVPCTYVPHDIGNRDCLYEQAMPTMYWGTEFVATRSYAKGANFIRITASEADQKTTITINGTAVKQLERGETYEIELVSNEESRMSNTSDHKHNGIDQVIISEYIYIKTSCPCAVYSYDCGASYKDNDKPEQTPNSSHTGDPSSVWIAPMEQSIDQITFGACGTNSNDGNHTIYHYMDIVVETAAASKTVLYSYLESKAMNIKNEFKPVAGTNYSYARVYLGEADDTKNAAYTVANPNGLVAHVYGNGKSESYAYSVGSSAITQGIKLDGKKYNDGTDVKDKIFCVDQPIEFDAKVGNDVIEKVTWDFGDGSTAETEDSKIEHTYAQEDYYDVTVKLWGHQICDETSGTVPLGSASVRIKVVEKKYVNDDPKHECLDTATTVIPAAKNETIPAVKCSDPDTIRYVQYGKHTLTKDTIKAKDSYYEPLNGLTYPLDEDDPAAYTVDIELNVTEIKGLTNQYHCDSIIRRHIIISTCLHMDIENQPEKQYACYGDKLLIPYNLKSGTIGDAEMLVYTGYTPDTLKPVTFANNDTVIIPTEALRPGIYKANIKVADPNCNDTVEYPIDFTVRYPEDIFAYMFNNMLAIYKAGYGGNEELNQDFTGYSYQWYVNGEAVPGETGAVYTIPNGTFTLNDSVWVVITSPSGVSIPSCPQIIAEVPDFTQDLTSPTDGAPAAQKLIINSRLFIRKGEMIYNIFGQRID